MKRRRGKWGKVVSKANERKGGHYLSGKEGVKQFYPKRIRKKILTLQEGKRGAKT